MKWRLRTWHQEFVEDEDGKTVAVAATVEIAEQIVQARNHLLTYDQQEAAVYAVRQHADYLESDGNLRETHSKNHPAIRAKAAELRVTADIMEQQATK